MLRTALALLVSLVLCAGALYAEEIKATFVKYADGKITVKVEDKEKTYAVDADAKVKVGKNMEEVLLTKALERYKDGDKLTLTVEKDKVTAAKRERTKKQDKN